MNFQNHRYIKLLEGCLNDFLLFLFGQVRTVTVKDEPWFVGKDVATALGYKNTKDALATHIESCDKIMGSQNATPSITDSMGRTQHVIRQIKRCLFRQIKTGLSEHLTMG